MTLSTGLQSRLDGGEVLVLDGAIGTELERMGAPMHNEAWSAAALGSHPGLVRQLHRNYIKAGADIITTNTHASARHVLDRAGFSDKVHEWNTLAARLALEVRDEYAGVRPVFVAGAISNLGNWREPDTNSLRKNYGEMVGVLADNGVDVILLETLAADVDEVLLGVESTADSGLPVWVCMTSLVDRNSGEVMLGIEESREHSEDSMRFERLDDAVRKVTSAGGSALLVMHSNLDATGPALQVCRDTYHGALGAYANAGYWQRPNWAFVDQVSPGEYADEAMNWVDMGAQIIGGCCGIGPEHIRAIRDRIPQQKAE